MFKKGEMRSRFFYSPIIRIISVLIVNAVILATGLNIFAVDANKVKVIDGFRVITVYTDSSDAEEIVSEAGLSLGKGDKLDLSDYSVEKGGKIVVNRADRKLLPSSDDFQFETVWYKYRTEKEKIKFDTEKVYTDKLYVGEKKIVTEGINGEQICTYRDKYVNGEVEDSKLIKKKIVSKPVTQKIEIGTKKLNNLSAYKNSGSPISELKAPKSLKLDSNGVPKSYSKCIKGKATAYTGDGITATGIVPKPGYIAVDPKEIPYGTECYVVSADGAYVYGYCIAADTGGFVKMGNTDIDLFMNNEQMCRDWGNRKVNIYVL